MDQKTSENIDTERPPAVQSLRSKFEQLSVERSPRSHHRQISGGQGDFLIPGASQSPRSRTLSNGRPRTPSNNITSDTPTLHPSSSSSDLKSGTKRPPPPPPPSRGPKVLGGSPTPAALPSPLLRPVPVPPGANGSSRVNSPIPNAAIRSPASQESLQQSVSSLRQKFGNASPYPNIVDTPVASTSSKPPVPPRSTKASESSLLKPRYTQSPEELSDSSATASSLRTVSPFSEDEISEVTPSAPPTHPFRRQQVHHHHRTHSSESSMTTSESDMSTASIPQSKSTLPPPPPSRFRTTALPAKLDPPMPMTISPSSSGSSIAPPPLPFRRATIAQAEEISTHTPPRLPTRPQVAIPAHMTTLPDSPLPSPTSATDRKPLGSGRLPPPPTRTIALGDKLPPPRRPPSPWSDDDSGEEEEVVDAMPDRSRTSRRPPVLSFRDGHSEPNIHVHAFTGAVSIAGTTAVVAHHQHLKIYDLAKSDIPLFSLEMKDLTTKDYKITSMEFRPSAKKADRGFVLWLGTKEGHLFELDARTGTLVASKHSAHLHAVTHIFRHGRSMITLDDSGKGLIFAPDNISGEDISLVYTQPRVVRIAEKQDFVKILAGKLWTATRSDQQIVTGMQKMPVIRVYDIFTPANTLKTLLPTEAVGVVTSAAIVSSQPGTVYVGHEAGSVSVWTLETDDGYPKCVEVMKVGSSDVMSIEGVNDRLWTGARSGIISVFDVSQKPWAVTNSWSAHPNLPVLKMAVDHYGIDKIGRLCVVTIGRDEQLKLWDGLLGLDWVDEELLKQEHTFSRTRDLKVLLVSWNCDAARPDSLTGGPANVNFLTDVLQSVDSPDIISFGFQEVIDLESRKMVARNVFLGHNLGSTPGPSKKVASDGGLSERVTGAYRRWYDRLTMVVRQTMPPDDPYVVVHTESLIGLFTCIFVKNSERARLKEDSITTIKRGMGGRYGNKGGIISRFVIDDSSICLVNCHLAAGQNSVRQRNADVTAILEEHDLFPETHLPFAYVGGGDGTMLLDHELVFVNGDMNYRIDHRREAIVTAIRSNDFSSLFPHDQLLREIKFNRACRFRGFSEGPLTFAPTYKYDPRTDQYDSSDKRRSPAWCDRVLWRSRVPSRVTQLHYQRYEMNVSDHRPISSAFTATIKSIKHEVRHQVKTAVQAGWVEEQNRLLGVAKQFYVRQALV